MAHILLGITGTDGAGKGENVWDTFARPFAIFFQTMKKNIQKVYSTCKQVFSYVTRILLASNQMLIRKSKVPVPTPESGMMP